ncbi:MAG TPA: hypothetical protein VME43_28675 [Bryobacteraceae bacterium]|nr:hypothetical protein [Bryobacteraceae bacterium]
MSTSERSKSIGRCYQARTGGDGHRALPVEGIEVSGCSRQEFLQAAFGDGYACQLGNRLDRLQERVLNGCFYQAPL